MSDASFHWPAVNIGNKQQQPKPVGDAFEVFQDQLPGRKAGGTRAKGATAAGMSGTGLIKQTKPRTGIQDRCILAAAATTAAMQTHATVVGSAAEDEYACFWIARDFRRACCHFTCQGLLMNPREMCCMLAVLSIPYEKPLISISVL